MELRLHNYLIRLAAAHQKHAVARLSALGLSPGQPKLLELLSRMDGGIQKELAQACGIEAPTLSRILDGMEEAGLIERRGANAESGKRAVRVFLSERGRAMVPQVARVMAEVEEICFRGFSEEDKAALRRLMGQALANLNELQE